ncbi:hypothetical protein [Aeromicrobium sp.]|uniref:hypothetical protein n=1 Tax=Aeromicrobium sp. TaxID=1871063 RepID=UPI00198C32DD|nr:hypothetical protein [Aeromicrobium sp.]MBC7633255.1 hypothetical protein [Aeromicrobium sp.]
MTNTQQTQPVPHEHERATFWRRKPTLWIVGGLGAAALLVGGIGAGAAMADDEDDDRFVAAQREDVGAVDPAATYGAKDAGALSEVLAAARDEANGTPTSLEAHRNGPWSVDFEAANGDETTVLVASDGGASVVRTDRADADDANDPPPAGKLNDKTLVAVAGAVLAEVKGVIVDVDIDDNNAEAYSVKMLAENGTETEIDLSTDFAVTQVDVDQD